MVTAGTAGASTRVWRGIGSPVASSTERESSRMGNARRIHDDDGLFSDLDGPSGAST